MKTMLNVCISYDQGRESGSEGQRRREGRKREGRGEEEGDDGRGQKETRNFLQKISK